jgi:signal transduction histidine kinase
MVMSEDKSEMGGLRPRELEAVYEISRAVAESEDVDSALDEIIRLSRPVFIFDNMVLYLIGENETLDPAYAKVVGRGQSAEGELSWGDAIAYEVMLTRETRLVHEKVSGWKTDRLALRDFLGLPLKGRERLIGALVFGRFGGPPYAPEHIHLAEFIAVHVAQLLGNKSLVDRVAQLEAERRLERLQQDFIATISHELCTPLGFIKGYATTLLREDTTWDRDTSKEFLAIIDEEADRLRALIDNLLDSSRLQSGTLQMEIQPVRLDSLVRDISVRVGSQNENLKVQLELKKTNVKCRADPTRLAQVLENLLNNAAKYAPGSKVRIGLEVSDDEAHIWVKDNGPGIAKEHLEHIFKRFYRVPNNSAGVRGTGLGLFICREIINAHGGEINVESISGKGSSFHIHIPCRNSNSDSVQSVQEASS